MTYNIDVYHLDNSNLQNFFKKIIGNDDKININFIKQSEIDKKKSLKNNIVIFEEDNYLISIELFQKIISKYKKEPVSIILSKNNEIFNVVQWMRKGATDYLVKGDFNKENFINTMNGSLEFILNKNPDVKEKHKSISFKPIIISKNVSWENLKNNESYHLSLVMIEIILREKDSGQYSKSIIDKIFFEIRNEINKISKMFGGKLWYWNNNYGVIAFYFDDKINCSILAAIYFYTHFFQICLEILKLNNIPHFKIGINEGKTVFNYINTGEITSSIINSLSHLTKKHTDKDCLNISENVYKKLNPRLKNYFLKIRNNNNNDILYQYQFYKYPSKSILIKK